MGIYSNADRLSVERGIGQWFFAKCGCKRAHLVKMSVSEARGRLESERSRMERPFLKPQ